MLKRHKDLMRNLVNELRHILAGYSGQNGDWQRGDLDRELERLGVSREGRITPLDGLVNPSDVEKRARYVADAQLEPLPVSERATVRAELVERAAYSWINRLLALRVMEARGLIDETLRSNPDYEGISEALYVLRQTDPSRATGADGGWWAVIDNACVAQSATLPGLFDPRDPAAALRPSTPALLRCLSLIGGNLQGFTLEESDGAFADPDAIGWAYQFYQEEPKTRTYSKLSSGGKASTRAEIAAVTQLFTEPYMVKWLLQNSLGRSYHEVYANSRLPSTWEYYVQLPSESKSLTPSISLLSELTMIDPCMGSGHFLREAFDMLVAMYREWQPNLSAKEIVDLILSRHLHGIDIDPRAAQLTALTLYLRAWELVRDEGRSQRKAGPVVYTPPMMNLATAPSGLNSGALQRHLRRHPEDQVFRPLLESVFSVLEHADILGSLLRPSEQLEAAVAELQKPHTVEMDANPDDAELRRTITEMAQRDSEELKRQLLNRVANGFAAEISGSDVAAELFGREAELGVRLLQLLDRRYAVVATNPPYMGSKNMPLSLKRFVENRYPSGKRDVYAAFILRCIDFCRGQGRVAMVTQHNWMFLRSFVEFRAASEKLLDTAKNGTFTGILRETTIEALAHLGPNAFEEINGEVVQNVMFTLTKAVPLPEHRILTFRLVGLRNAQEKGLGLKSSNNIILSKQSDCLLVPSAPIMYWIVERLVNLYGLYGRVSQHVDVPRGLSTGENNRFIRCLWEIPSHGRTWCAFGRAGRFKRWWGLRIFAVEWPCGEFKMRSLSGAAVRNTRFYENSGATFSQASRGCMGVRVMGSPMLLPAELCAVESAGIVRGRVWVIMVSPVLLYGR